MTGRQEFINLKIKYLNMTRLYYWLWYKAIPGNSIAPTELRFRSYKKAFCPMKIRFMRGVWRMKQVAIEGDGCKSGPERGGERRVSGH